MLIDAFVIFFFSLHELFKASFREITFSRRPLEKKVAANYNLPTVVDLLLMLYVFA